MATIKDVATLAGVSTSTAKRAITHPEKLRPHMLRKVLDAVQELDYEPDLTACALRRGRNNTVGLLVADIMEPFFAELAQEIGVHLRHSAHGLLLANNEYQTEIERHNLRQLSGQKISALIIRPSYGIGNLDDLLRMQAKGTYIIEVDHHLPDSPFDFVMLDHEQCVRMGLEHLLSLGRTRIAGLGQHHPENYPEWRAFHFERLMGENGLLLPEAYRRVLRYSEEDAYPYTLDVLSLPRGERPTAIFAFNGSEAIGARRAICELGLSIPEDVSLLAFDNYAWTDRVFPGIDMIVQPVREMARALVEQVLSTLDGQGQKLQRVFPGVLLVRGSCQPPPYRTQSHFASLFLSRT